MSGQFAGDVRELSDRVGHDVDGCGGLGQRFHETPPPVSVEEHAVSFGQCEALPASCIVVALLDDRTASTCSQPEQRSDAGKRKVDLDSGLVEIRQLKEFDVFFEAVRHRKVIVEFVVADDWNFVG